MNRLGLNNISVLAILSMKALVLESAEPMSLLVDEPRSQQVAKQIKSKARRPFENAYRAALVLEGATYVQGFLIYASKPYRLVEHGWLEVGGCIVDPTLPHLNKKAEDLSYFPAHRLTVKQLKVALEEAKEDYPEDDPLPIYGTSPYEYYGDVMLGGQEYLVAYQEAEAQLLKLNQQMMEKN